ncbi:MAG: hypothetical protein JHD23_03570 [Akkermansiaceae bacterium]|nr:hypothetical protein [Akkermansiaceae bacterium]
MIPISPPPNPSQAVERLREIIVGRQFEQFEQRLRRLEIAGPSTGLNSATSEDFDDRLSANEALMEARLEAMHENMQQLVAKAREHTEHLLTQQREATLQLTGQVQQLVSAQSSEISADMIRQLEQKIETWLTNWQNFIHLQLNERDQNISAHLHREVATLWENTESQITALQSRAANWDTIEQRFSRIALAARALAECASPTVIESSTTAP